MKRAVWILILPVLAAHGQTHRRLADYALILKDTPAARVSAGATRASIARIRSAQAAVASELENRKVEVIGSNQVLVNAIFVSTTRESALRLRNIPGVAHVVRLPRFKPDLSRALDLQNVKAAWSALDGDANAGAGIKIGIIDSGIDINHPGFQDPSLTPPAGFPKGEAAYTNSKVIVARSYVPLDSAGYNPDDPVATSHPDDYSPRDHMGHGTAIAMIAAGVRNTGPAGTIEGVAPQAFLGNYKVFGSPGINDTARFAALLQALQDALADGMDIVTLSLSEGDPAFYGPLDTDPDCGGACDIISQAVESAVSQGMVVVASAGNDGSVGQRVPTLNTIHYPGTAPSAITVGAVMNSHTFYQSVVAVGKTSSRTLRALFGDGPHIATKLTAPVRDVSQTGNDGLACSSMPGGTLAGAIALIRRGTCSFSDKINNAQNAGAIGVIIYQSSGQETLFSNWNAQDTGIPAVMIGNSDGVSLAGDIASNTVVSATLDPSLTEAETTPGTMWPASSRGPSPGTFGVTPTTAIKPELVAVGAGIYTATQKLDPNADTYHASGYTSVSGTSYAVPMVAGAVALVKQKYPSFTPAQLKSAVVNTATQDVTEANGEAAGINSMGAGKLNAGDAVSVAATLEPATIQFGPIGAGTLPISRTLTITNVTSSPITLNFDPGGTVSSAARVLVSPASLTIQPSVQNSVTVSLEGGQPTPGSYESFITITGAGPTLHVPYQFLAGDGIPADAFPIGNGGFVGGVNDQGWELDLRVVDRWGVPVVNTPLRFNVVQGGGRITAGDQQSFRLGNAAAIVNLGPDQGDQIFNATVGSLTVPFNGYARVYPAITPDRVLNAASFDVGQGLAPGSYIAVYGTALSDATQVASTAELPVSLSDVSVSFDGGGMSLPGHIHFVSPGQVNVQIPWEFQGQTSVYVKVTISGLPSERYLLPLAKYSPGIFAVVDATSGAVVTSGGTVKRGDTLVIYANGLGPVDQPQDSGQPAPLESLVNTTSLAGATIGGVAATVLFSGLAPGYVGLYQVNAVVPDTAPTGAQSLVLSIGGIDSKGFTLAVQ